MCNRTVYKVTSECDSDTMSTTALRATLAYRTLPAVLLGELTAAAPLGTQSDTR
jgi:hypothetical protein